MLMAGMPTFIDIVPGTGESFASDFTNVNNFAFFTAATATGTELWKGDGTLAGTVLVKDIKVGP